MQEFICGQDVVIAIKKASVLYFVACYHFEVFKLAMRKTDEEAEDTSKEVTEKRK